LSRLLAYDSQAAWKRYCGENAKALLTPWCGEWENGVLRVANGIPHRVDRIKGCGNAIVPQAAYPIFQGIVDIERQLREG